MANPSRKIGPCIFAAKSEARDNVEVGVTEMNPMNISLVVVNICKYLNLEELKVCRTLNLQWKEESEKYLSCPPLKLGSIYSRTGPRMSILRFMEVFNGTHHNHPKAAILRQYKNFDVEGQSQSFESETEEQVEVFYDFLSKVGPQMTSLTLNGMEVFRDPQDVYDILTSKYTPKLESLRLECVILSTLDKFTAIDLKDFPFNRTVQTKNKKFRKLSLFEGFSTNWENTTVPWLDVLSRYPNIKTLQIEGLIRNDCEKIATALVTLRQDEKKFNLTELELRFVDDDIPTLDLSWGKILYTLQAAKLPLKHLGLKAIEIADEEDALVSFLQAQSGTLKSLTFTGGLPHPHLFPILENLEQYETILSRPSDFPFLFQMPNLKSLKIDLNYMHFDPRVFRLHAVLVSIKCLSVIGFPIRFGIWNRVEYRVTDLERFFAWMPNIQSLKMQLNTTAFFWVCENLIHLKELSVEVVGNEFDDSAIIGETMRMEDGVKVVERRPGITNLTELERFVMYGDKSRLTDKSVFQGFSLMPRLSYLEIKVARKLSLAARLALAARIKTVKISF